MQICKQTLELTVVVWNRENPGNKLRNLPFLSEGYDGHISENEYVDNEATLSSTKKTDVVNVAHLWANYHKTARIFPPNDYADF